MAGFFIGCAADVARALRYRGWGDISRCPFLGCYYYEAGLDGFKVTKRAVGATFGGQLRRGFAAKRGEWLFQSLDRFGSVTGDQFGSSNDTFNIMHGHSH